MACEVERDAVKRYSVRIEFCLHDGRELRFDRLVQAATGDEACARVKASVAASHPGAVLRWCNAVEVSSVSGT